MSWCAGNAAVVLFWGGSPNATPGTRGGGGRGQELGRTGTENDRGHDYSYHDRCSLLHFRTLPCSFPLSASFRGSGMERSERREGTQPGVAVPGTSSSTVRWEIARSISRAAAHVSAGLSPRLPKRVSATRWCRWYSSMVPRPLSVSRLFPRYRATRPRCSRGVRWPSADGAERPSEAAMLLRDTPFSGVSRANTVCRVSSCRRSVSAGSPRDTPESAGIYTCP